MASVKITVSGVLFDKYARTGTPVTLVGEASLTGLGVGGGPIIPPDGGDIKPPDPNWPPGIWPGPGDPDFPGGGKPPHIWGGGNEPFPTPPIVIPPFVPPALQPPTPPKPGDPTTAVPGNWPVNPMVQPAYIIVNYPGVGPVYVAPPASTGRPADPSQPKR